MKTHILLIITLFLITIHGMAQRLTITGTTWAATATPITEAGNDYTSSIIESGLSQTTIDIKVRNTPGLNNYTVNVKKTDSGNNWGTLGILIKRTGIGTGGGPGSTITGGTTYVPILTTDSVFFNGANDNGGTRSGIPIQYQISGISVLVPVGSYSTTITYTLIDN